MIPNGKSSHQLFLDLIAGCLRHRCSSPFALPQQIFHRCAGGAGDMEKPVSSHHLLWGTIDLRQHHRHQYFWSHHKRSRSGTDGGGSCLRAFCRIWVRAYRGGFSVLRRRVHGSCLQHQCDSRRPSGRPHLPQKRQVSISCLHCHLCSPLRDPAYGSDCCHLPAC